MEAPREVPPNKSKIDTLLASCSAGETTGILTACEVFITEDEFFSMGRNTANTKTTRVQ